MVCQTTAHLSTTRTIKALKDHILNILHDAPKLIGLNPLVVGVRPDDKTPGLWDVIDTLTILGCFTTRVNYTIFMKATEDGINSEVEANQLGFDVKTSSVFTVIEVGENVCDVVEDYTILRPGLR
ncbi:hypothetical protein Clacol_009403 [Clathrus columnatus]|uniref:Uncharacterized protein n=1 Tax=Clathrus columnatus TaxID=1419009 RepID=A0AAV5AQ09_9AGAM|nr:hypothetical protein Clacol_009403 [Clathrus columnatus]